MKLNLETLRDECTARDWTFTHEDAGRFMIRSDHASVSVVDNLGGEARLYANGTMREVVSMIRVLDACDEEKP